MNISELLTSDAGPADSSQHHHFISNPHHRDIPTEILQSNLDTSHTSVANGARQEQSNLDDVLVTQESRPLNNGAAGRRSLRAKSDSPPAPSPQTVRPLSPKYGFQIRFTIADEDTGGNNSTLPDTSHAEPEIPGSIHKGEVHLEHRQPPAAASNRGKFPHQIRSASPKRRKSTDTSPIKVEMCANSELPEDDVDLVSGATQEAVRDGTTTLRRNSKTIRPRKSMHGDAFNKTCYCGGKTREEKERPMFQCGNCGKYFHQSCIQLIQQWKPEFKPLLGDDFYFYRCKRCSHGRETMKRLPMTWVDVIHVTLFHLSATEPPRKVSQDKLKYYGWKTDICAFIDRNWSKFWLKSRTATWENTVASCLSTQKRFLPGTKHFGHDQGLWALESMALPSSYEHSKRGREAEYDIGLDGALQEHERVKPKRKRLDLESDTDSVVSGTTKVKKSRNTGRSVSVGTQDGANRPRQKRRPKKKRMEEEYIDPATAIELYPDVDNPRAPVQMSNDTTHRAPQMTVTDGGYTVYTDKGYRMAKATHGVWEGSWYYEVLINEHQGHTRIGWSQISGDLQAPCGYDRFSYAYRDNPGTLFHVAKAIADAPEGYAAGYGPGDVIGMSIHLPPCESMDDLLRRLWTRESQYLPFRSKPLTVAEGSEIIYYKNGECLGVAFRDLYRGKYHPAISSYKGGSVTLNFGPNFRYPPPPGVRPFCEADSLPLWDTSQAELDEEGRGDSIELDVKGEMEIDTPGNLSSLDGEGEEDEGPFAPNSYEVGEVERKVFIPDSNGNGDGRIVTMDADEVSGIEALLSLGGMFGGTSGDSPKTANGYDNLSSTRGNEDMQHRRMAESEARQHDALSVDIEAKEAEVVELIRRSSGVEASTIPPISPSCNGSGGVAMEIEAKEAEVKEMIRRSSLGENTIQAKNEGFDPMDVNVQDVGVSESISRLKEKEMDGHGSTSLVVESGPGTHSNPLHVEDPPAASPPALVTKADDDEPVNSNDGGNVHMNIGNDENVKE
ncbi:uncharacterized protein SPPG_04416 [Spizellomyces punctatus DAOM BR117]|uniref:B30.2/SPRY domain-containing protein n=1 Tax=Spizellomyces punctatus (strain DAOM BR117) TaxID=645134 RepID=A0A0L0HGU0_SPIPD|nr:uncharacterized protein SPPG_04416 [Spizellomyces punctatus DAOM BR117]KND00075.1 hypothetical protein SPPG_04416 [Spizellomyces punctatus DAOM BR117]|eukprot:XP_016608114.1 hypothetical protein SPPG_04416 [Spizellomyces punctatus DAOM BR117]